MDLDSFIFETQIGSAKYVPHLVFIPCTSDEFLLSALLLYRTPPLKTRIRVYRTFRRHQTGRSTRLLVPATNRFSERITGRIALVTANQNDAVLPRQVVLRPN